MDFIFMLTRGDQTVDDALDVLEAVRPVALRHMGFKDVGVDPETLRCLNQGIKAMGATSYLEVVSTTPEACLNSARVAVEIGIDRLMGGTDVDAVLKIVKGTGIEYFPFPGVPQGHPTRLGGTPERIAAQCTRFGAMGCAGADLLAYRATDADPLDLVRAARAAMPTGRLIAAGSVSTAAQISVLAEAGVDGFTIGSAVFDGSFSPHKGTLRSRLADVLAVCA